MGQFFTPPALARDLLAPVLAGSPVSLLEPSFGDGAFLIPAIEHYMEKERGSRSAKLGRVLNERVWGVEIDAALYERTLTSITSRWGVLPSGHNLHLGDYFRFEPERDFAAIVGNPPFGGTFDRRIEDALDRRYGTYRGKKLKKETYSFFIAKALGELRAERGMLMFICSDTFLTIKTMAGLRMLLMDSGQPEVRELAQFSEETNYDMVELSLVSGAPATGAMVLGDRVSREAMKLTGNFSWRVKAAHAPLFEGPTIGDFMVATGGMTIGRNELFVREIVDGEIVEPHTFEFVDTPITLEEELKLARLGKLSARRRSSIEEAEAAGQTRRRVSVQHRQRPVKIRLPHPDYALYNKASGGRLYTPASHVVYWRNEGDAVLTFKKTGPWYLRGVGGGPYFKREGITWQLVAPRINARYLPPGYVLDSGAPCAFLREEVPTSEMWLILGWLQTTLASSILKEVLNHTRNIQGKDIERLPYPWWVSEQRRRKAAQLTQKAVQRLRRGATVEQAEIREALEDLLEPLAALPRAA